MYPRKHPDLDLELLASLAEATEKYEVFSVMNTCQLQSTDEVGCVSLASSSSLLIGFGRNCLPDHVLEIMVYGVKHDYRDIASLAAPNDP